MTFPPPPYPNFDHLPPPPPRQHPFAAPPQFSPPSYSPPPLFAPPAPCAPTPTIREWAATSKARIEANVRNLVLTLGVLSLLAAAISFVAMNWDSFDATLRASIIVAVTTTGFVAGRLARRRGLAGTASALEWLGAVLLFIDVFALQRALYADASTTLTAVVGGGVLLCLFFAMNAWQPSLAFRGGAITAWLMASYAALAHWQVTGPDLWVLPLGVILGWAQWKWGGSNVHASSWERYGIALVFVTLPAVVTALGDPNGLRPVVVIGVATATLLVGVRYCQLAAIWTGGAALGVLVSAELFTVIRGFPGWLVFAIVGFSLLIAGAGFEYHIRQESRSNEQQNDAENDASLDTPFPSADHRTGQVTPF